MIRSQNKQAFTLMEIMLAMVVLGILATFAVPAIQKMREKIRINQTEAVMVAVDDAIHMFEEENGQLPLQLEDLIEQPKGLKNWRGPYLMKGKKQYTSVPRDGWDKVFEYNVGKNIVNKDKFKRYELISTGGEKPVTPLGE